MSEPSHNDPNPVLFTRRPDARTYVLAVVMPWASIVPVVMGYEHIGMLVTPRGPLTRSESFDAVLAAAVWTAIAAVCLWFTFGVIRSALSKTVFRAQSVQVVTLGWVRRSVRYSACERFVFVRKRHYPYGAYAGTYFKITVAARGRRPIVFRGKHRERALGPGATIFWKHFAGSDEIDRLPRHIGAIMADAWEQRLAAGEQIRWLGGVILTAHGVIPASGPFEKQCVPYHQVGSQLRNDAMYEVMIEGDRHPILVDTSAANFWPGALLLERRGERVDEFDTRD